MKYLLQTLLRICIVLRSDPPKLNPELLFILKSPISPGGSYVPGPGVLMNLSDLFEEGENKGALLLENLEL